MARHGRRALTLTLPALALLTLACRAPREREVKRDEAERPLDQQAEPSVWDPLPDATPPRPSPPPATTAPLSDGQRLLGSTSFWLPNVGLYPHPHGHLVYGLGEAALSVFDPTSGLELGRVEIEGTVDDLAFLDSARVVVARRDYQKQVWLTLVDLDSLTVLDERRLDVAIRSGRPRLSPDGRLLATTSGEIPTRLWRVRDGKRLRSLGGRSFDHEDAIPATLAGGGERIVGASFTATELYGEDLGTPLASFEWPHPTLLVSPDGERVIASEGNRLHVVATPDGEELASIDTGLSRGRLVAISASGKRVAVSDDAGDAAVVDLDSQAVTPVELPHLGGLSNLAFVDDTTLIYNDWQGATHVAPIDAPERARGPLGHGAGVRRVAFVGEDRLVTLGQDQRHRLWDLATGALLAVAEGGLLAVAPDGAWFATGSPGFMIVRDRQGAALDAAPVEANLLAEDQTTTSRQGLARARWWKDGTRLTELGDHDVHVRDQDGDVVKQWPFLGDHRLEAQPGVVDPSGEAAAMWDQDAALVLVDAVKGRATDRIGLPGCLVPELATFVKQGGERRFFAMDAHGKFVVLDAGTGEALQSGALALIDHVDAPAAPVSQVRAAPDGIIYFTLVDQGLFRLDLAGNTIAQLRIAEPDGPRWSGLDISPSGEVIALGRDHDGLVETWDRTKLDALTDAASELALDEEHPEACALIEPEPAGEL